MTGLRSVQTVLASARSDLDKEWIANRRPVVIKGLFARQPIGGLSTPARVRAALGAMPVQVVSEYFKDFLKTKSMFSTIRRPSTLGRYLDLLDRDPSSPMVVTEMPTPSDIAALLTVPAICGYRLGADGTKDGIASEIFVAGRRNVAHLHFDWDHRHVLLHQVFGRKRICLIPPEKASILNPILNTSLVSIELMSHAERSRFLDYVNGVETVLYPGDTIYIPPLMWHFVEYVDLGMSIGLRFGRGREGRVLQERFHPNMHLQNIAWKGFQDERPKGNAARYFRKIISEYVRAPQGGFALYKRMQRLFEDIYAEFCTESVQGQVWYRFNRIIEEQVRAGIKAGVLYPRLIRRAR